MPFISIESIDCDKDIVSITEVLAENIEQRTMFPKERIVIKWWCTSPAVYFRGGHHVSDFNDQNNEILVTVTCSLRNGKENIDTLVRVLVEECSRLLDLPTERITVILNAKEPGFLYVGNTFI